MQTTLPIIRLQSEYTFKKDISPVIELLAEFILVEKAGQGR
ncbi:unnamed protein product [Paramecium primaurelia]|uniref:Uncharacterized protein n=1 Tax=Paramecium primaurelia TaxID=5886 RepID=A0A8S1MJP7_PARPR|nr:unnamed protein product [Paramecium primaurelia]